MGECLGSRFLLKTLLQYQSVSDSEFPSGPSGSTHTPAGFGSSGGGTSGAPGGHSVGPGASPAEEGAPKKPKKERKERGRENGREEGGRMLTQNLNTLILARTHAISSSICCCRPHTHSDAVASFIGKTHTHPHIIAYTHARMHAHTHTQPLGLTIVYQSINQSNKLYLYGPFHTRR